MYKILQLLFVGVLLSQTNDQTNCNDGDWHYIMPNFMEELELLLSGEFDLQDSSKFIDGLVNERREHQSWKISHDVYFSKIKDNITNELSNFLNPNYFTIYYKSRQLRHMSNYFEDLEKKTNFYDLDNIKKYIEETYCVDNGNGSHYTVSSPYGSASFSKDQGIVIHVVFNYNQQSILELQKQYAGHQSENKIYENFDLNQFTRQSLIRGEVELGYLKEHFIDGFTIQFGAPFFDISIDKELYHEQKDLVELVITEKYPHLLDCEDCIYIHSVDMDSLRGVNNTISLNRDDIYDDSWAVIIGIDKYKYSDQLNYAVKDAEAVKEMLINKFDYPEENIRYLVDEEATLSNIKLNLGEVATSAGENDRILVFYSGHGETLKGADESETGYIVPFEGKIENLYATGLAMDEILRTCQMSKSKHMLFLMDACYSGLMTENVKSLAKPIEQGYLSKVANEKARQIITAGDIDEQVIERDEWQHSAFTKNLLVGLDDWEADTDDDGYITADELGTYLRKSVTEDSDFQQTPQKGRFRNSGGGEFVFFGSSDKKQISRRLKNNIKDKFKLINVQIISQSKMIDYLKNSINMDFDLKDFKEFKTINDTEIFDIKSNIIKSFNQKYYHEKYKFVDYNEMDEKNYDILYYWADTTIDREKIAVRINEECNCYDTWLIGIVKSDDTYFAGYVGHTFDDQPYQNMKFRDFNYYNFNFDAYDQIIGKLDVDFLKSEINIHKQPIMGSIISIENEIIFIKLDNVQSEEIIGLYFEVERPYFIDTNDPPLNYDFHPQFSQEDYLLDLKNIIEYIDNNSSYKESLEIYKNKVRDLNIDMNQEEIYKSWHEELFIELQILEKKDQIFKAKVIYNKYPWFYPKVNDKVRFLIN